MRPRATMQQWPNALWRQGSPQSEREIEILLAFAQFILVVWWRATIHSHYSSMDTDTQTLKIKFPYTSVKILPLLNCKVLHCNEFYPIMFYGCNTL